MRKMSFESRRRIDDPRLLRALAHPVRLSLLDRLMSFGDQTAAGCAAAVGSTPANCSYHLRALGRAGLVERAPSGDGRERPWRAVHTGLSFGAGDGESPAAADAALTLHEMTLARGEELTRLAHARHARQPEAWRAAEEYQEYALHVSAAELATLTASIDRLVRPYIAMTREDPPADARAARLRLLAFRDPRGS